MERLLPPDRIRIRPAASGAALIVAPAGGGRVCALTLVLAGVEYPVLDGFGLDEDVTQDRRYRSAPLIPFPNRMKDGRYLFDGVEYQLPINEPQQGHAVHGLAHKFAMRVDQQHVEEHAAELQLSCRYAGHEPGYPFPFSLETTYRIEATEGFSCVTTVRNTGSSVLPLGVGWHPYLALAGGLAEWTMQLPPCQVYAPDYRSIPTGPSQQYSAFQVPSRLAEVTLNHCFHLSADRPRTELVFGSPDGKRQLVFWQDSGPEQYRYFQLYTPPGRASIAVEPMSCGIDAFNNHDGLLRLGPGAAFRAAYGLQLRSGHSGA